jgi:hypothetical protein
VVIGAEVVMGGFAEVMRQRVRDARAAVAEARAASDPYAMAVAVDELEDALRLARENDVALDPVHDDLPVGAPHAEDPRDGQQLVERPVGEAAPVREEEGA